MKLLRALLVIPALLVVALIRLLRPVLHVRFGELWSERLGHLAGNTECYLCEKEQVGDKCLDLWFHRTPPANKQIGKMIDRVLHVDPTPFTRTCMLVNTLFPGWQWHNVQATQLDRDVHNLFERQAPHIGFNAAENDTGERWARGLPSSKWVCVIVRDGAYLKSKEYHRYRDADIATYIPAMQYLADLGYTVLRMGAAVEKPLPANLHPRIIDYASNGMRTDFLDAWLGANCDFCISTGCGFDAIPYVFRRPILYTNYVPVEYLFTFAQHSLAIWKHHEKDGKRMAFKDIIASGAGQFMSAEEFEGAGIKLVDNTADEILAATREMVAMREGRSSIAEQPFWETYPRSISPYNKQPLHGAVCRMRICPTFLKGYA